MKPVSMSDVARRAGVSKNTVSLALRSDPQIPATTRARIARIASRMGYRRNPVVGELMARLHAGGSRRFQSTLALINAHSDPQAFTDHPTIPLYVKGCRRRANELGYRLDDFWMHDPTGSARRLMQIFHARGIAGGIIVGLMKENRIPEPFLPVIEALPFVVTGVRTRDPALSFACVDHHMVALRAFEKVLELGYKRPGLVLDREIDALVDYRFSAGYHTAQQSVPAQRRLRPFFDVSGARANGRVFREWLQREKPDVIFTLYNEVREWVEREGRGVPEDIALVQYEWRENKPEWPGMNQHNDLSGQAAVDMLVGMLHRGERGPPPFPLATLIGPSWAPAAPAG
jgi:LacI family transcriptional regulator